MYAVIQPEDKKFSQTCKQRYVNLKIPTVLDSSVFLAVTMLTSQISSANHSRGLTSTTAGTTTTTSTCSAAPTRFSTVRRQSKTMSSAKVTLSKTTIYPNRAVNRNARCAPTPVFRIVSMAMILLFLAKIVPSALTLRRHLEIKFYASCQMTIASRPL